MFPVRTVTNEAKILVLDTECRPMHYSDWRPEGQITGWAMAWLDAPGVLSVATLDHGETDLEYRYNEAHMLAKLLKAIRSADVVVGHYIRKHDLPLLNETCLRLGLPLLPKLQTIDTKADLTSIVQLGASLENLGVTLIDDDENGKHHMCGGMWRIANQLTVEGKAGTAKRVMADVVLNIRVLEELRRRGALGAVKWWEP